MDRRELRRNQVFGIAIGMVGGLMAGNFWPSLPAALTWGGVLLWGAAIGAALGSLSQFERAGRALTRSDNRAFNTAVALCIPLALIAALGLALKLIR